ncbi:GlsB/YeaQ/YmgE family stress response membrane protein [Candidatus Saccharibacteria bacterium]|nr:GlsB/YeaQ/YmgE family stress response membrane protein [Candidatus Saccharibacteria bacterium]
MTEIILWILFGALAGWIASMVMNTDHEQGALGNIVVGIVGAFLGGFLYRTLTGDEVSGFNIGSLLIAIGGAIVLLAIVKTFRRGPRGV